MVIGPHSTTYSVCNGESEFKRGVQKRILTPGKVHVDVKRLKRDLKHHKTPPTHILEAYYSNNYVDLNMLDEFITYVRTNVHKHFKPLPPEWTIEHGFEVYYNHSRDTIPTKEALRKLFIEATTKPFNFNEFLKVTCFPKNEFYPKDLKEARCINGCSKYCKAFMAPIVHAIEMIVFKNTHFIKGLDEHQKAYRIAKKAANWSMFAGNDMTSLTNRVLS